MLVAVTPRSVRVFCCCGLFVRVVLPALCRKKACMSTVARIPPWHYPPCQICFVVLVPHISRALEAPYRDVLSVWMLVHFVFLCSPWHGSPLSKAFWVALAPYVPTWLGHPLSMVVEGRSEQTLTVVWDGVPDPY